MVHLWLSVLSVQSYDNKKEHGWGKLMDSKTLQHSAIATRLYIKLGLKHLEMFAMLF